MSAIILDSSALLAMLRDEPGGELIADNLAEARMSAVNLAEVVSYLVHKGMPADAVDAVLRPLPIAIREVDEDLALLAGRLRATTSEAGLSLGDRFCLALAIKDGLPAWTADRQWQLVADKVGVDVLVIR